MGQVTKLGMIGMMLCLGASDTTARSLEAIGLRGSVALCAHPNALPFASKKGDPPGFQIELGQALAKRLGVSLTQHWVVNTFQYRRADCDIVLDAIADRAALAEVGLRMSRPYHRSGIILAVQRDSDASSLAQIRRGGQIGVQVGSMAAMVLQKRGLDITPFAFEDEMLDALAQRRIEAAAVTPAAIGWFNVTHPDAGLRPIAAFEEDPDLNWNVAVGMLRPDKELTRRIDTALEAMLADGTIARIYARYGVELRPPQ